MQHFYLRNLIRNILLETPELQDAFLELQFNRQGMSKMPRRWGDDRTIADAPNPGTMHKDELESEMGKPMAKEYIDLKREMKRFWNENADHGYWKTVTAVHSLGYYEENDGDEERGEVDPTISEFIQKHPIGKVQKDEMSCYGLTSKEWPKRDIGIVIKGRVTFASAEDAFSETRGAASPGDRKRHAGSGLPKRPSLDFMYDKSVLFDETDVKNLGSYNAIAIQELIVDNWKWDTVIIPKTPRAFYGKTADRLDSFDEEVRKLNRQGIKVVDQNFQEYKVDGSQVTETITITQKEIQDMVLESVAFHFRGKLLKEDLTGVDKSEIKKIIKKELDGNQNKKRMEKEINKILNNTDSKDIIVKICKDVITKLYKELSFSSKLIDRLKV